MLSPAPNSGQRRPSGFAALFSDYRRFVGNRLWLGLALMIFGALAEGFGLLTIVPIATMAIHGEHGRCPLRSVDRELDHRPTIHGRPWPVRRGDGDSRRSCCSLAMSCSPACRPAMKRI